MSYFRIPSGSNLVLHVQLSDGNTSKYVRAHVFDAATMTEVVGSPFVLGHVALGLYANLAVPVPDGRYVSVSIVYEDPAYTTPSSRYGRSTDIFDVNDIVDVNAISEGVWREGLSGNSPAGSFGEAISTIGTKVDNAPDVKTNTDTLVSRLTSSRASAMDNLPNLDAPVSGVPGEVWDATRGSHTTAGTFGEALDVPVSSRQSEAQANSRFGTLVDEHNDTQVALSSAAGAVAAIKSKTDQMSFDGGLLETKVVTNEDKTGYGLSTAGLAALADSVWDESLSGHSTAGSAGEKVSTAATGTNPSLVAAAVWNEPKATHANVGTFGEANQGVVSVARAAALDNLDVSVSSREAEADASARAATSQSEHDATQASLSALSTKVGSPAGASVSADIAAVKAETAVLNTKLGTPSGVSVSADIAAVKADTTAIAVDTATLKSRVGYSGGGSVEAAINLLSGNVSTIKGKTDNLSFIGGEVVARATTVADKTGYSLIAGSISAIVDGVWDETLSSHSALGSTGEALATAEAGVDPSAVADAVWDESTAGHSVAGSFSTYLQSIKASADSGVSLLQNATYGLSAIRASITTEAGNIITEVNANEAKIDAIVPAVNASQAAVVGEVNANETKIDSLSTQLTNATTSINSNVDANETKIDAVQATVSTIQNNTTARFIVPERLIKPSAGSKNYQFHLRLSDTAGNPEAPDATPTIRIRRLDTGVDVVAGAAMTQDGGKVGAYYYDYSLLSGSFEAPLLVEATVVENGVTRYIPATSEITEFESDLTSLSAQVSTVEGKVDGITGEVQNGVYGLNALKAGQTTIVSEVNANETKLDALQASLAAVPTDTASSAEVGNVLSAVNAQPDLADITTVVNDARDSIKGAGNRDATQLYNQQANGFAATLQSSDARLNNLDAAISSRSTLTANDVWSHVARTLTAFPSLAASDIDAIWAYPTVSATAAGSIGKRIADYVDAAISSRATAAQVSAELAGVAQEATLVAARDLLDANIDANETKIDGVRSVVDDVFAKANQLPSDPASQSAILSAVAAVAADLATTLANTGSIKTKTDTLPAAPASEATVAAIPTNPLLASDSRLNNLSNLDAPISGITSPDISGLAEKTDVTAAHTTTNNKVDANNAILVVINALADAIKAKTDGLPADPAAVTDVTAARDAVLNNLNARGPELTAADVWGYGTREITQDPTSFGPDISGLAEKSDLVGLAPDIYEMRMSTVRNPSNGEQEIIAWAEKNGQNVTGTDCAVDVKDALGQAVWDDTLASPNADGVFRFSHPLSVPKSQNYYVTITITVDGQPRTSRRPFFTIV